jgi:murein DD-endopeptidase MepM/ murein hydrolase activator NlpD
VLKERGGKVRLDLTRHWRWVVAAVVAAALTGACTGGREAPPARAESGESSAGGLAHANGAVLDVPEQPSNPASAIASNGSSLNGSASMSSRSAPTSGAGAARTGDTARATAMPVPTPSPTGSAAVAPTPDELSALAASLVVPVAGVTPAELRGSFHAPRGGGTRQHNALDIPAPRGTPVISATSGRVLRLFNSNAGGLMVYAADATERFILMYGHLDRYAEGLKDGMPLARGQTIGYVGTTGNAPPNVPHLHFAIARTNNVSRWWNGTPIDPAPLFKR